MANDWFESMMVPNLRCDGAENVNWMQASAGMTGFGNDMTVPEHSLKTKEMIKDNFCCEANHLKNLSFGMFGRVETPSPASTSSRCDGTSECVRYVIRQRLDEQCLTRQTVVPAKTG
ncbi:hypothetical protein [Desulfonatronum parangueonense]